MKVAIITITICVAIYAIGGAVKSSANSIEQHNKKLERALNGQF